MTKKLLLLFFTCLSVLSTCPMQEVLTLEHAVNILKSEGRVFLEFLSTTNDAEQCSKDYLQRLIQHMQSYPGSQDIWFDAIVRILASSRNRIARELWELQLQAAQSVLGTDAAREIATELVPIIVSKALMASTQMISLTVRSDREIKNDALRSYLPYLTVLFEYGAHFTLEFIKNFNIITTIFEQYALQVAQTTPFRASDKNLVAYHLLKNALDIAAHRIIEDPSQPEPMLSKEDIRCDETLLQLSADNVLRIIRTRESEGRLRPFKVKSNYGPLLLHEEPLWDGRIFHVAYAPRLFSQQTEVNDYLKDKALLSGCIIQEILFQGRKLPLSYHEIRQALQDYGINYVADNNSTTTADDIFITLLQDDPRSLQYYTTNKETILASLPQGNRYSIRELGLIMNTAEEIRARDNSVFNQLKNLASYCSIQ